LVLNAAIFIDEIVALALVAEDISIDCSAVLSSNVTLIRLVPVVLEEVNAPFGSTVKMLVFDDAHNMPVVAALISRRCANIEGRIIRIIGSSLHLCG